MVFSSLLFISIYLPITLLIYYIVPQKHKNLILFIASLIFYAWGEPYYVVLLLLSTIVDYTHGILLEKNEGNKKNRTIILISSCIINLGLLAYFKYSNFFIDNLNHLGLSIPLQEVALPIGISFYTFQTMSYTIDVYRGHCKVQHNIISFGCYVAMFPQLVAGPIVRYVDIEEKLNHRQVSIQEIGDGIFRFSIGLGKKVLLANGIGRLWDIAHEQVLSSTIVLSWMGIIAFALQLYFDFSGYSDMAIGLGHMFGFTFTENFNYPYISRSITEFWRRWHISLGTWFKEYVYIPLGGNRKGMKIWLRNVVIVWLLTGLWHGASWNFIFWGIYFGMILCIEKLFFYDILKKLPSFVSWLYSFIIVMISWCFFACDTLGESMQYIKHLFYGTFINLQTIYLLSNYGLLLLVGILCAFPIVRWIEGFIQLKRVKSGFQIGFMVLLWIICLSYIVTSGYNPFLYFRF